MTKTLNREPKISVIVPVYKVEPYLRKCLDSIINQTYRNLQIILVDDGSPDNCGAICDEYASKDSRIEVIHQENGGVSAARNAGLKLAAGDYIGWVDSDDWIEPDMYAYMLENMQKYEADIAVCSRLECFKERKLFKGWRQMEVLDKKQALEKLLENGQMQNYLWDKLWRRELFAGITFPDGRTFEDIAVMHRIFAKAQRVVCLPEAKYFYLQHNASIVGNVCLKNRFNHYLAAKERYVEMVAEWPQFEALLLAQCAVSAVGIWSGYLDNPKEERMKYLERLAEISAFCREHYQEAIQYANMGVTGRAVLRLTLYVKWWSFALAKFFSWLYKLKHGRNL